VDAAVGGAAGLLAAAEGAGVVRAEVLARERLVVAAAVLLARGPMNEPMVVGVKGMGGEEPEKKKCSFLITLH